MPINFPKLTELGLNDKAIEIATKWGGKPLAKFIDRQDFEQTGVEIPKADYLAPGILETNYRKDGVKLAEVKFGDQPLLARACLVADPEDQGGRGHAGDFGLGTVMDMMPTEEVHSQEELFTYLDKLANICKTGETEDGNVRNCYSYEGGDPDRLIKKVGVLLAEYSDGYTGSIVEHPAEDGVYMVEHSMPGPGNPVFHHILKREGEEIKVLRSNQMQLNSNPWHDQLVKAYEKIKSYGFIPKNRSFHMEFSLNENNSALSANQIKLFWKKYTPANKLPEDQAWELKQSSSIRGGELSPDEATTEDYAAFGVTGPKGIELDLYPVDRDYYATMHADKEGKLAYAYSDRNELFESTHKRPHLGFMPKGDMEVGIFHESPTGCIAHGGHWIIANSKLGIWQSRLNHVSDFDDDEARRIRVTSDGIRARVEEIPKPEVVEAK